mmetsp:Transcript_13646/g.20818  ORF Transcript_13646/g.20818 Transcript_13646/m.20818 type:complete len:124 (-) Transcript_13646:48-419(-)
MTFCSCLRECAERDEQSDLVDQPDRCHPHAVFYTDRLLLIHVFLMLSCSAVVYLLSDFCLLCSQCATYVSVVLLVDVESDLVFICETRRTTTFNSNSARLDSFASSCFQNSEDPFPESFICKS